MKEIEITTFRENNKNRAFVRRGVTYQKNLVSLYGVLGERLSLSISHCRNTLQGRVPL